MLFLLDMRLPDQSCPGLYPFHCGHWCWPHYRGLLVLGCERDSTGCEVPNSESPCDVFFFPCLGIDATNLIFRAEGLYYSQHVSVDGIYSFLCCLKLWTSLYGFPWVISLAMSPDYHNLRRGQIDNST